MVDRFSLMTVISFFLIIFVLRFFTGINQNVIISIALVMLFLALFTFVFKTQGHSALNVSVIVFSFICLPLFILWYLGIFESLSWPWGSILLAVFVCILGVVSIATMVKLNYVEIDFEGRV